MSIYKHPKLQEAFDIYVREQNARLPSEEELAGIVLSDEFKARMEKLIRRQKHGYYVLFGTVARRVATIIIALLVGMTVTTFSVEALRQPVVRFFTEVFETFTRVIFVDDTSDPVQVEMEKRTPTYIPEGYVVESEVDAGALYKVTYVHSESGERIYYRQQLSDRYSALVDTETTDYQEITVAHLSGIVYQNKETTTIAFIDDQCSYSVFGTVAKDELLKIAESISPKAINILCHKSTPCVVVEGMGRG
ncbi:MAG: DUF4367 domain-containing protein [Clostridia bacterium]|nr:DUF4367 domain-containing protein [Clostridia bacterium]